MTTDSQDIVSLLLDESFQRWLLGKASQAEAEQWNDWLRAAPHRQELCTQARELWKMSRFRPAALPNVEQELQKLQRRLDSPTAKPASIHDLSARRMPQHRARQTRDAWWRWGAVAVAATLLLTLAGRHFFSSPPAGESAFRLVSTQYGQRTNIKLPDGTTITLNANSTLRYPAAWDDKTERRCQLRGEAYFEVSHRQQQPQRDFIVETSDGSVKVVGTRFVVHERNRSTRVVVEDGRVAVAVADSISANTAPSAEVLLTPGQLLQFKKGSRNPAPQIANIGLHTTWRFDFIKLEDTPFEQVILRLEETYGVHVEVADGSLLRRTLSGAIDNRNLEVTIDALAKALRLNVRREKDTIVFSS